MMVTIVFAANLIAGNLTFHMELSLMGCLVELSRLPLRWLRFESRRGVSAIEYGLLAALIALVIISAVTSAGTHLKAVFTSISTEV